MLCRASNASNFLNLLLLHYSKKIILIFSFSTPYPFLRFLIVSLNTILLIFLLFSCLSLNYCHHNEKRDCISFQGPPKPGLGCKNCWAFSQGFSSRPGWEVWAFSESFWRDGWRCMSILLKVMLWLWSTFLEINRSCIYHTLILEFVLLFDFLDCFIFNIQMGSLLIAKVCSDPSHRPAP